MSSLPTAEPVEFTPCAEPTEVLEVIGESYDEIYDCGTAWYRGTVSRRLYQVYYNGVARNEWFSTAG